MYTFMHVYTTNNILCVDVLSSTNAAGKNSLNSTFIWYFTIYKQL